MLPLHDAAPQVSGFGGREQNQKDCPRISVDLSAAARRVSTASFCTIFSKCFFAVFAAAPTMMPISGMVLPWTSQKRISVSRGVSLSRRRNAGLPPERRLAPGSSEASRMKNRLTGLDRCARLTGRNLGQLPAVGRMSWVGNDRNNGKEQRGGAEHRGKFVAEKNVADVSRQALPPDGSISDGRTTLIR